MNSIDFEEWADAYIQAQLDPDLLKGDGEHPLWWAVEKSMFMGDTDGEDLWQFILAVSARSPPEKVVGVLAAGPLEDLIAYAGQVFIDRIEIEARRNPTFRHLLGGVWQQAPEDVWRRVEAARCDPW